MTAANYADLIATSFGDDAPDVARRYPLADYDSAPLAWSSLVTDVAWACTTTHGARDLAAATKGPGPKVYSYEFADPSAIDVSMVASSGLPQAGAHATDLPFLFDLGGKNLLETRAQRRLGRTMVQLWTSFAHTGTPAAARVPRWRPTTATKAPVLQPHQPRGPHGRPPARAPVRLLGLPRPHLTKRLREVDAEVGRRSARPQDRLRPGGVVDAVHQQVLVDVHADHLTDREP